MYLRTCVQKHNSSFALSLVTFNMTSHVKTLLHGNVRLHVEYFRLSHENSRAKTKFYNQEHLIVPLSSEVFVDSFWKDYSPFVERFIFCFFLTFGEVIWLFCIEVFLNSFLSTTNLFSTNEHRVFICSLPNKTCLPLSTACKLLLFPRFQRSRFYL